MLEQTLTTINQVAQLKHAIAVDWSDGHRSSFHNIWLRDNCMCSECGDRSGGHRYLELNHVSSTVSPASISIEESEILKIVWSEDNHVTEYPAQWLRNHCYTKGATQDRKDSTVLWDASLTGQSPIWDYADACANETSRLDLFQRIHDFGFALIDKVPKKVDEIERLASVFGFIRQTHYGRVFDLISKPQKRILAETSHAIRPHNDELFRDPTPGMLVMHCLQPSDCGGGASVLTDGFNAATKLREQDREAYDLLCETPLTHWRYLVDDVDDVALRATWKTIHLDNHGNVIAFRFNERTMAPFDAPPQEIEPLYLAMQKLASILYAKESSIVHTLETGQAVVFDNHRVLHAREAFSGARHIRQCHIDRDEVFSRMRSLQHRHSIT